jgi:hypothetical protein
MINSIKKFDQDVKIYILEVITKKRNNYDNNLNESELEAYKYLKNWYVSLLDKDNC